MGDGRALFGQLCWARATHGAGCLLALAAAGLGLADMLHIFFAKYNNAGDAPLGHHDGDDGGAHAAAVGARCESDAASGGWLPSLAAYEAAAVEQRQPLGQPPSPPPTAVCHEPVMSFYGCGTAVHAGDDAGDSSSHGRMQHAAGSVDHSVELQMPKAQASTHGGDMQLQGVKAEQEKQPQGVLPASSATRGGTGAGPGVHGAGAGPGPVSEGVLQLCRRAVVAADSPSPSHGAAMQPAALPPRSAGYRLGGGDVAASPPAEDQAHGAVATSDGQQDADDEDWQGGPGRSGSRQHGAARGPAWRRNSAAWCKAKWHSLWQVWRYGGAPQQTVSVC